MTVTVVLAVGLVASGCGGGPRGGVTTMSAQDRAIASYRTGLRRWGQQMIGALNGMSLLFSTPKAVQQIEAAQRTVGAKLERFERTLAGCTAAIERLGPPPGAFVVVRRHALHACENLEKGAALVKQGVKDFQTGLGADRFTEASGPLNDGQGGIGLVRSELKLPAPG